MNAPDDPRLPLPSDDDRDDELLAALRAGWHELEAPAPHRELADEDAATRAVVAWVAAAWRAQPLPAVPAHVRRVAGELAALGRRGLPAHTGTGATGVAGRVRRGLAPVLRLPARRPLRWQRLAAAALVLAAVGALLLSRERPVTEPGTSPVADGGPGIGGTPEGIGDTPGVPGPASGAGDAPHTDAPGRSTFLRSLGELAANPGGARLVGAPAGSPNLPRLGDRAAGLLTAASPAGSALRPLADVAASPGPRLRPAASGGAPSLDLTAAAVAVADHAWLELRSGPVRLLLVERASLDPAALP
jgi:hypothetical protein